MCVGSRKGRVVFPPASIGHLPLPPTSRRPRFRPKGRERDREVKSRKAPVPHLLYPPPPRSHLCSSHVPRRTPNRRRFGNETTDGLRRVGTEFQGQRVKRLRVGARARAIDGRREELRQLDPRRCSRYRATVLAREANGGPLSKFRLAPINAAPIKDDSRTKFPIGPGRLTRLQTERKGLTLAGVEGESRRDFREDTPF